MRVKKEMPALTTMTREARHDLYRNLQPRPRLCRAGDGLCLGATNRCEREELYCGGKGINVSLVLHELGIQNTALGFIAGFTGTH